MSDAFEAPRSWAIRRATPEDAPEIAAQRAAMFAEMGHLTPRASARMRAATEAYVRQAIPRGEYTGWLVHPVGAPTRIVAGAGVQRRPLLPRPTEDGDDVLLGEEALVLNVWVDTGWRRRGIAEAIMREILAWAPGEGFVRVSLHTSAAGRPLYERLGFIASSEMRYPG